MGIFAVTQNGWITKIVGLLCILFFGFGTVVLAWNIPKDPAIAKAASDMLNRPAKWLVSILILLLVWALFLRST